MTSAVRPPPVPPRRPEDVLRGYVPLPGVWDELVDAHGTIRPHWRALLAALADREPGELSRRFASADRYLRDAGVFFRVYDAAGGDERPWPMSHVPVLLDPQEWAGIEAGLVQRAELLEAILADVYGPGTLTRRGLLPAGVIAGNPEFLRPMVGARVRGEARLWFYAADLGRGPDGRWWVLADRAQAPSGAGYALENRVAMMRALADVSRTLEVERLAGFFQVFRAALADLCDGEASRIALLTPGPLNETYFEHAYLARYLGLLLLEGGDLAVRDGQLFVRTVAGLRRVDVLWRRLDAAFADPLELNADSRIGIPGLVRAVHAGSVTVANALGAGLVDARAMLGFLPRLARALLGEDLRLPNIATWWCGQPAEQAEVLRRLPAMVIAAAFPGGGSLPGGEPVVAGELEPAQREALARRIAERGADFVGQEVVKLSTTPVWVNDRLEPRPCTIRAFVARTRTGWQVMPGAFCRISERLDARAVSMQQGSLSADVWIPARAPAAPTTLLSGAAGPEVRRQRGALPSRAADNLFWIGRYVERAEGVLRLLRAYALRAADGLGGDDPIQRLLEAELVWIGAVPPADARPAGQRLVSTAFLHVDSADGLASIVAHAQAAAARLRDRLSPDVSLTLRDLAQQIGVLLFAHVTDGELVERINRALRLISAFSGLVHENMSRLIGWRFLQLGQRLERGLAGARLVRRFAAEDGPEGTLDLLLELADSVMTHRRRYTIAATRASVVDLVTLDANNPRSIAFQAERIVEHVAALPGRDDAEATSPIEALGIRLSAQLRTARPAEVDAAFLDAVSDTLRALSNRIGEAFFAGHALETDPGADRPAD